MNSPNSSPGWPSLQSDAVPVDEVTGFNYSRGKKVHVTVYRVRKLIRRAPPSGAWSVTALTVEALAPLTIPLTD